MEVHLKKQSGDFQFKAYNASAYCLDLDASINLGGSEKGFRPMELVLTALGSCSSFDLIHILKKQKLELSSCQVKVEGKRSEEVPSLFDDIHLHYSLQGNIAENKIKRALELSIEKYCSVAHLLQPTANITYSYELINQTQCTTIRD